MYNHKDGTYAGSSPKNFSSNRSGSGYYDRPKENQTETPDVIFKQSGFNPDWITKGADANLPAFAEKMGKYMATNELTNSKIRSIYGEIKRIQMVEFDKAKSSFYLLKPKVAYALGRDSKNKGLQLFKIIFDECFNKVNNQMSFNNFSNLVEAVLAYHKANGGKD